MFLELETRTRMGSLGATLPNIMPLEFAKLSIIEHKATPRPSRILTTFPSFSLLPPELRIKIWRHAMPARTISVRYNSSKDMCSSSTSPPALLHATHESRTEALRCYLLTFATPSHPAHIYLDPSRDTLYLPRRPGMGYDDTLRDFRTFLEAPEVLDGLESVALDCVGGDVKRPWEAYNKLVYLQALPNLKRLFLVLQDANDNTISRMQNSIPNGNKPSIFKKSSGDFELVPASGDAEHLFGIWASFRQDMRSELSSLEAVCRADGREYVHWEMPRIFLKSKAPQFLKLM